MNIGDNPWGFKGFTPQTFKEKILLLWFYLKYMIVFGIIMIVLLSFMDYIFEDENDIT